MYCKNRPVSLPIPKGALKNPPLVKKAHFFGSRLTVSPKGFVSKKTQPGQSLVMGLT